MHRYSRTMALLNPTYASGPTFDRQPYQNGNAGETAVWQGPGPYFEAAFGVIQEILWPTRCALCDVPGLTLCDRCRRSLPYIDYWRACPRCGAPYGSVQCSECNPVKLSKLGVEKLPYDGCVSTVLFDDRTARLVKAYKDRNEQRLSSPMASLMACTLPPCWLEYTEGKAVSFIPSTRNAFMRRGFDHAELLAAKLAGITGLSLLPLFERPSNKDQRSLSRHERTQNMQSRFTLLGGRIPRSVILIDDVYTTGSTLIAASEALSHAGAESIVCATFARV